MYRVTCALHLSWSMAHHSSLANLISTLNCRQTYGQSYGSSHLSTKAAGLYSASTGTLLSPCMFAPYPYTPPRSSIIQRQRLNARNPRNTYSSVQLDTNTWSIASAHRLALVSSELLGNKVSDCARSLVTECHRAAVIWDSSEIHLRTMRVHTSWAPQQAFLRPSR